MDKFIKLYRKSVGLTDSKLDGSIRLIFVIHICLALILFEFIFDFLLSSGWFGHQRENLLLLIITLLTLHLIPRLLLFDSIFSLILNIDNALKTYRKFFFLTNSRYDNFERIIFTLHILITISIFAFFIINSNGNKLYVMILATCFWSYLIALAMNALVVISIWIIEPLSKKK